MTNEGGRWPYFRARGLNWRLESRQHRFRPVGRKLFGRNYGNGASRAPHPDPLPPRGEGISVGRLWVYCNDRLIFYLFYRAAGKCALQQPTPRTFVRLNKGLLLVWPDYDIRRNLIGSGRQDDQDRASRRERIPRCAHGQGLGLAGGKHPGGGLWLDDAHQGTGQHLLAGTAPAGDHTVGQRRAAADREGNPEGEPRALTGGARPAGPADLSRIKHGTAPGICEDGAEDDRGRPRGRAACAPRRAGGIEKRRSRPARRARRKRRRWRRKSRS